MSKNMQTLIEGLVCVAAERKFYEGAGVTWVLTFEHDASQTDNSDMLNMTIEIAAEVILQYEFKMWDGRSLVNHVVQIVEAM